MKNKTILIAVVAIIIIIAGVWYFQSNATTGEVVKVGVMGPFAGPLADFGEEAKKGVEQANVKGIEFIYEDDQCDPATALSAFKKLVDFDKVKYIVGPGCGAPQEVIAPLLAEKDVVVIVPSAASAKLYSVSEGRLFNVQYSLEDEAKFIADTMYKMGYENVALIAYQNSFSQVHADSFKNNFQGNIIEEIWISDPAKDISSEVLKLKNKNIDAIFSTDISFFFASGMQRLSQYDLTMPVFSQYAVELPVVRPLVEGVYYSFPGELKGDEGAVLSLSREATEVLGGAIKKCGEDTACVRNHLVESGYFDENGVSVRPFILKQIKDGQAVEI